MSTLAELREKRLENLSIIWNLIMHEFIDIFAILFSLTDCVAYLRIFLKSFWNF